jgi:hypothetical protein
MTGADRALSGDSPFDLQWSDHIMKRTALIAFASALVITACGSDAPTRSTLDAEPGPTVTETTAAESVASPESFDQVLELQGITFHVTCPNASSINEVSIVPAGLEIDNSPIVREVDGSVVGAEVADLDANGSPEIYVYVSSAGSGSYGSLVAYAANNRKSLSDIYLPPLDREPQAAVGYMGHDRFSIVERNLGRRFPVYREGDTNAQPSGGTRQLRYRLEPGEAGWILRLVDVLDLDAEGPAGQ